MRQRYDYFNVYEVDLISEEDLKKVLQFLPKGTLLTLDSFTRAVRSKQYFEEVFGTNIPDRKRKHEKYQTEVQVVGVVLIRMGFALATPLEKSPYSRDIHDVHLIHGKNLDTFFIKRMKGYETSSLKLKTDSILYC